MKNEDGVWRDTPKKTTAPRPPVTAPRWNRWLDRFFSLDVPDYVDVRSFAPPYEIFESDAHYLMSLDLPGVSPDQVTVEVLGNELVISGERRGETIAQARTPFRAHRRFGRFRRAFTLPPSANEEGIEANCWNGVLEIAIPKLSRQKRRAVPVRALPESLMQHLKGAQGRKPELGAPPSDGQAA